MVSYDYPRPALYSLLWVSSIIELGLTGYRVHHTKSTIDSYDPIVVELLVTAALTLLWVPVAVFAHLRKSRSVSSTAPRYAPLHGESAGLVALWIMYLVGAAIATNKWPSTAIAGPGRQGHILITLVAFAWIAFSVLSIIGVFLAMHYAYLSGAATTSATRTIGEKTATGPSPAPVAV